MQNLGNTMQICIDFSLFSRIVLPVFIMYNKEDNLCFLNKIYIALLCYKNSLLFFSASRSFIFSDAVLYNLSRGDTDVSKFRLI